MLVKRKAFLPENKTISAPKHLFFHIKKAEVNDESSVDGFTTFIQRFEKLFQLLTLQGVFVVWAVEEVEMINAVHGVQNVCWNAAAEDAIRRRN